MTVVPKYISSLTPSEFFLEDESGRLELDFASLELGPVDLITGMCVALRGAELENGKFAVRQFCLPSPAPTIEFGDNFGLQGFLLVLSGINQGGANSPGDLMVSLDLLIQFIEESRESISGVLILGNSLGSFSNNEDGMKVRNALGKVCYSLIFFLVSANTVTNRASMTMSKSHCLINS
jgi:hypothetical protein